MLNRKLGATGPTVSAIGLGCMGLTAFYGAVSETEAETAVRAALDLGITLFDTAEFYGAGENERRLGRALKGSRDQAIIATKLGMRLDENKRPTVVDGSPKYLKEACDASLARLGVETIDIAMLCRLDRGVPVEESVGALSDLVKAGKVLHIGLSEVSSKTIRRAHAVHAICCVETEYSIWERHIDAAVLPALQELSIGLLAYSPLGRGLLTGALASPKDLDATDLRRNNPRFKDEAFDANKRLVDNFTEFSAKKGSTPGQIALAWLLARDELIVPIPGSKRPERIRENAMAADVSLSETDMKQLDVLFPSGAVQGGRYPEAYMGAIDKD